MKSIVIFLAITIPICTLWAQGEVTVNDMKFRYEIQAKVIEITLEAPTLGWVGVGFNDRNSIEKSDLLLFHVIDDQVESLDMHVIGFGNPKKDQSLGGTNDIKVLSGKEEGQSTSVTFSLPFPSKDTFDFQHQLDKEFWLILAYSTHDEFDHHSRMRKHILFSFSDQP